MLHSSNLLSDFANQVTVLPIPGSQNNLGNIASTFETSLGASLVTINPHIAGGQKGRQVVFIDTGITAYNLLAENVMAGMEVVILDPTRDGISQITETLAQYDHVSGVHVISHGESGQLQLGSSSVGLQQLYSHREALQTWSKVLTPDADILLYGCNVGAGEEGHAFITALGELTGADVAASTDLTGSAELNGNWILEVSTGDIESSFAFNYQIKETFNSVLVRIEAEDFVTAFDTTAVNIGGAYRPTEAVDIEVTTDVGGGFNVGWTAPGEWLTYSVTIPTSGTYNLTARVASAAAGPHTLGISMAGQSLASFSFGSTGGWQSWTDATTTGLVLEAGTYTVRLDIVGGTYNVNYFEFVRVGDATADTTAPTATLGTPGLILANTSTYDFTVIYTDDRAIAVSSLGDGDVVVSGPNGFSQPATLVSLSNSSNGSPRTATYRISAPGGSWDSEDNGTYTVSVVADAVLDASGNAVAAGAIGSFTATVGTPPPSTPGVIRVEAEDFVTAFDTTAVNIGGAYRPTEAVDIEVTTDVGGGFNVGWTAPGEWLTYSVTIPTSGMYDLVARVASNQDGFINILRISLDGQSQATLSFSSTGGWQSWTDEVANDLFLEARTYEVRLDIIDGSYNINYFEFVPVGARFALQDNSTIFVSEAAGGVTVTVVRTGNVQERMTVEYTTNEIGGESAQAGIDYITPALNGRANTGQIVFEVGETAKTFTIPIVNDSFVEGNETFAIGIQNPSSGTLRAPRTQLITIVDDDGPQTISISETSIVISEGVPTATITVLRSGDVSGTATVDFTTRNGTAIANLDYTPVFGTLTFAPGQVAQLITVPILDDAIIESTENFFVTLSNSTGAALGSRFESTITILDNDLSLGTFTRQTVVSGLSQPTTFDWTPDGRYMLVAQKNGIVRVVDNGVLRTAPLIDLSNEVNDTRDRGMLGLAVHPNFPAMPYVYLLYTYDDPVATAGQTGLAGPDGNGNRPARLVRVTVNPETMVADPTSKVVLLGNNSIWAYTSEPGGNSTGNNAIPPSGIVGGSITAPADQIEVGNQDNFPDDPEIPASLGLQNQNIRDYLAGDSESHTIGQVLFGPDGYLYVTNGDGTSYNFMDPRTVRVQDINNLSGKVLRIDPITGQGVPGNPFFEADDPNSNQSKVFQLGLRNPFRFTFDPITTLPVIGDVGWGSWEEINSGPAGSNFGWPYFEGPAQTGVYSRLSQAIAFYANGNRNNPDDSPAVFPLLARTHGAPDFATAIFVGDFINSDTLMFGDIVNGTIYAATFDSNRNITNVQLFDANIPFIVDMEMGPDGRLYGVNLAFGTILRWNPA
ncbi:MAG TPA: DUF4347 domain-containing protein [Synechococcales cyanobacterium M55_K2018_004]|nr:DUF4347 domain-containing protein [Synechococcales cyanobacterium M55_K2018_004]